MNQNLKTKNPKGHSHDHPQPKLGSLNRAFIWGIALNLGFVFLEFGAGFYTKSLALLSDAGHNLSDVATLALSLFAFRLARRKATERYTYGFHRATILASLANAVILLIVVGSIGWEAVVRFIHPVAIQGTLVSLVAAVGIVINVFSALLFFRNKDKELNAKSAYLHLALDALVSLGVVVAGLLINRTGAIWLDPLTSLLVMTAVVFSTWGLLKESLSLSMDAVPEGIDIEEIKNLILKIEGIKDVYHIHIWAISTTKNAMTAHLMVDEDLSQLKLENIKNVLRHDLEHLNVHHITLETEIHSPKNGICANQ